MSTDTEPTARELLAVILDQLAEVRVSYAALEARFGEIVTPDQTRELLEALLEAIAIPFPETEGDAAAHDAVLLERVSHARTALSGVLKRGDEPGWSASYLRERLAEHPTTGYNTAAALGECHRRFPETCWCHGCT